MNRLRTHALPLALVAGWVACRDGSLTHIEIPGDATTTVSGATILEQLVGDLGFDAFVSMDITSSEELRNQGVAPGDIEDTRLVLFELEATAPEGADLSFLHSMEVWVEAPGLDPVLLAHADTFPEGEAVVSFDVEDIDLTAYVVSESMTLRTEVDGQRPDTETTVEARYLLDVGVTLQGAKKAACGS